MLILDFFHEIECPFCKRVRDNIIDKLRGKNLVKINAIDVDASLGCEEMAWYRTFCREVKSEPTPLLRLHDEHTGPNEVEYVFLMWKKKPTTLTQEVLSSEEFLEKQIYDKIRLAEKTMYKEVHQSYDLEKDLFFSKNRVRPDARIYQNQ